MSRIERIKELIAQLNKASYAYYNSSPIMTDYEWDEMYDELCELEKETGLIYPTSPTQNVGYKISDELEEVEHNHLMLSLDKTKSVDGLLKFSNKKLCVLSVKCDGLTCSLKYSNGKLISAETRGDGYVGSNVLQNVLTIKNVPQSIPYKGDLIIDGEVIIDWNTFNFINDNLPIDKKYKHPRNLVSGSLTLLDSREAAERNMRFVAWRVIEGFDHWSVLQDLKTAEGNGFEVVPFLPYNDSIDRKNIDGMLSNIQNMADEVSIPYDGAVMAIDSYKLAESMGRTDKFFRHSYAYKYEDELYETVLEDIEWNTSKTGLINPVAIFQPVDLDGAVTTRATLHNVTYIKNMMLGIGDRIRIYRSNKVIPKVHDSIDKSGNFTIPTTCPICGSPTKIVKENESEVLMCTGDECPGKLLGIICHASNKNALNIDGLSEATIQKFISLGWVKSIKDLYHLEDYKKQMMTLEGFGKKSVENIMKSIENSRKTRLDKFIYSLSIPLVGRTASRAIAEKVNYNFGEFMQVMVTHGAKYFKNISGIGNSLVSSLDKYFNKHCSDIFELSKEFDFEEMAAEVGNGSLKGTVFVITGSLEHFANRDALKSKIESLGGKVSGSVSSKTTALINNDIESSSSKNKKAKSLGIPILTENMFIEKYLQ